MKPASRRNKFTIVALAAALVLSLGAARALGSHGTNIDPGHTFTDHWAWNDVVGWIDFYPGNVQSRTLDNYANSPVGVVSLNCGTLPMNDCDPDYKVINDGAGYLSGWAWNDTFGWFSFCGGANRTDCPGSTYYQTYINPAGEFRGYAWNDVLGWVSFNCRDLGSSVCTSANYKVVTSWIPTVVSGTLESATIDTGVAQGAQYNSIVWRGDQPAGTMVRFKFAASNNPNGDPPNGWALLFRGKDCTNSDYYESTGPGKSISLNFSSQCNYNNNRYFRYRVYLFSDVTQTITPRVDDVVVNWSP